MFNKDDFKAVNAVRTLSVAQIEKANSGHPGLPMGASPMAVSYTHLDVYKRQF